MNLRKFILLAILALCVPVAALLTVESTSPIAAAR